MRPNERFDDKFYARNYPEVADSPVLPLVHWVQVGATRGHHTCFEDVALRNELAVGTISFDNSVIVGRNGNLFVYGGSNFVSHAYQAPEDPEISKAWAELLLSRSARAQARGYAFRQVFIPEKASILPEYAGLGNSGPTRRWEGAIRETVAAVPGKVVDGYALMVRSLNRDDWFRRQDSHLSSFGALEVSRAILNSLGMDGVRLSSGDRFLHPMLGDLGRKFPEGPIEPEHVALTKSAVWNGVPIPEPVLVGSADVQGRIGTRHIGIMRHWKSEGAPIQKRLICFGNSFFAQGDLSCYMSWWFARLFAEFRFVWCPEVDWSECDAYSPDMVIGQSNERFLGRIPAS
jgi:hypothetical protein